MSSVSYRIPPSNHRKIPHLIKLLSSQSDQGTTSWLKRMCTLTWAWKAGKLSAQAEHWAWRPRTPKSSTHRLTDPRDRWAHLRVNTSFFATYPEMIGLEHGLVAKSCLILVTPCSPPGSSVPAISQPRVLESEVAQSSPTLCNPMDCSLPGSSIYGIFQTRVLKWVASSFSRGSFQPGDQTQVSCIAGGHFNLWATREECIKFLL